MHPVAEARPFALTNPILLEVRQAARAPMLASRPRGAIFQVVDAVIELYKRGVDRTLLRRNLALTPEERLRQLMELQRLAEELRRAGRSARRER